jgi:hypothetical protein
MMKKAQYCPRTGRIAGLAVDRAGALLVGRTRTA